MASEAGAVMGVGQIWHAAGGGGTSQGGPVAAISVQKGRIRVKPVYEFVLHQ